MPRDRYVVATVRELFVPDGSTPDAEWDRFATAEAGGISLFATGPIALTAEEIAAPDFAVEVHSHGRMIHGDPMSITTRELALLANAALTMLRYHEIAQEAGLVNVRISHGDQLRALALRCGGTIDA
jgi:hypothetical protein